MISPVVLKIMELCCAQDNPEFRRQWIEKALTFREKMQLAPTNHLLYAPLLEYMNICRVIITIVYCIIFIGS